MEKAKVFISCGQSNSKEKEYGIKAREWFSKKGFNAYFAEEIHTPEALTENIFNALKESEYFVLINFARTKQSIFTRKNFDIGSLFVQQELAIASFLKIQMIGFHVGNIKLEGVEKYILVQSTKINSTDDMIRELVEKVTEAKGWFPNSKNQLFLNFGNHHHNFPIIDNTGNQVVDQNDKLLLRDWYHIIVDNGSYFKHAINCSAYIESIKNLKTGETIFGDNYYKVELMWAAAKDIRVNIPIRSKRDLDAFFYDHQSKMIVFNQSTIA